MQNKYWVGSEKHVIRVNEVDNTKSATLPALVNLMQEVAWNNSADLKYSVYDLLKQGVTWVVSRLQIHLTDYPKQQDVVKVESWPSGMDRLYTYRDYRISDGGGKEIVRATSAWVVMDINKRQVIQIPAFIKEGLNFEGDFDRLAIDRSKMKPIEGSSPGHNITVRHFDMDANGHVSNTFYIQWILEALGCAWLSQNKIDYFDILFKGEARAGDNLVVNTKNKDGRGAAIIIKNKDNKELVRAGFSFIGRH
ncbi:MAG: thioesterase [Cyclobacteriaceae bacterium]